MTKGQPISFLDGETSNYYAAPSTLNDSVIEVLALQHESGKLGQWSNPVSGSRKSQASSPWAKQEKPHTGFSDNVREFYSRALEQGNLLSE